MIVHCEDKYEAQKLASLIYIADSNKSNIHSILDVIESEVVIALHDGSAHSVLLKNKSDVAAFEDFIQSVVDGEHKITSATILGEKVKIEKI